ncbi:serine/threonine protein kinase [Hyalangium versicolor]|uniref:serine/threonine protein kinase n=1 Tax=Hyalangium versicolor TaxID=2861190 RepID=UPI001CCF94DB|nr:serine/threonine-protein kinase [Hyalangium versicolor]
MQHPFHLMPDMMVGPFRIQARLGAGGFGAVFRAECNGELYAIKFAAHPPGSEDLNLTDARTRRELACLLLIRHPNVVRVWAHGRWPHPLTGHLYFVMDYVEGTTLLEWVKKTRPPLRQVLRLFDTLALTLDALHAEGIHHRDLKGSNILVRARDSEPMLVDFGAAEHPLMHEPLTEGPLPPGTPHLRTPEAVRFHREQYADPEARYRFQPSDDLYALGCTLYEVLTGAPPFPPTLPREVLTSLIEKEMPASPAALNAQVPEPLGELVLRLLAKRPEDRPASGRALHELFEPWLRDEAPNLDVSLSPGANAATTEGMGGPAVMSSAEDPEGPLSGPTDWGGPRALPGTTSPSEDRAPTVLEERASPGPSKPERRRWVLLGASGLVLLAVLGVALWGNRPVEPSSPDAPAWEPPVISSEPLLLPTEPVPSEAVRDAGSGLTAADFRGDAGPDSGVASLSADAGLSALAEAHPSSPHLKGPSMRTKPPAKNPSAPPEPEKPRSPGSGTVSPLAGVVAACALVGGCASSDAAVRLGPPPRQLCPPGAEEAMKERFGLGDALGWYERVRMPGWKKGMTDEEPVIVTEGRHEVVAYRRSAAPKVPPGLVLVGDFIIADKLYARFVEARLPNGERIPFCAELDTERGSWGVPFLPGSKPGAMMVGAGQRVRATFEDH